MANHAIGRSIAPANPTNTNSGYSLAREIALAAKLSGITLSRFGRDAAGDPRLYFDLTKGRQPRHDMRVRILMHLNRLALEQSRKAEAFRAMAALHGEARS